MDRAVRKLPAASLFLALVLPGTFVPGSAPGRGHTLRVLLEPDAPSAQVATPSPEPVFQAPAFPRAPKLVERPGAHRPGHPIARVDLTYWKLDGRELGPWDADLYLPPQWQVSGEGPVLPSLARAVPAARSALIVVLPVGGLRKDLRSYFAKEFAKRGFAVLALGPLPPESGSGILHSLKGTARTLTEDVANLRRIVAWASALPAVDPDRVGILGVSRGALGTALAAQIDPHLSTVLVLGGADLAGLFKTSRLGIVEAMRRQETARAGGSLERAVEKARGVLKDVDPATRAGRLDPGRTVLINARWDRIIPRDQALALRRTAGDAPQFWLPSGHYASLLFARRVRSIAAAHFERTLGPARRVLRHDGETRDAHSPLDPPSPAARL